MRDNYVITSTNTKQQETSSAPFNFNLETSRTSFFSVLQLELVCDANQLSHCHSLSSNDGIPAVCGRRHHFGGDPRHDLHLLEMGMNLNDERFRPRTNFSPQIPGHLFTPIITTSLALYLVSFFSLMKGKQRTDDRAAQGQRTSSSKSRTGTTHN